MEYTFIESPLDVGHPNVVRFDMYDDHNRHNDCYRVDLLAVVKL